MAVRARRIAGGLAVAGALLLAAPATALAQEVTPAPAPPVQSVPAQPAPPQVSPAPLPTPPLATRAPETQSARPAPPTVRTAAPVPAEATPGRPGQVSRIPQGAPETGGGATATGTDAAPFVFGGIALLGAAGAAAAVTVRRKRGPSQG